MTRPANWDRRLHDFVEEYRGVPFAWGSNDCCTFALENYRRIMLREPALSVAWSSMIEAARLLQDRSMESYATEWFDVDPVDSWKRMKRGDVGLTDADRGIVGNTDALAVCIGPMICGPGAAGLEFYPVQTVRKFWPIT